MYFDEIGESVAVFRNALQKNGKPAADYNVAWKYIPYKRIFERIEEVNGKSTAYYVSPFSKHHSKSVPNICRTVKRISRRRKKKYIYTYWHQPDTAMHNYGVTSEQAHEQILLINKEVEKLCNQLKNSLVKLYEIGVAHKGCSWLDIGTGTGVLPLNMYSYGVDIKAIDNSESQIAAAKLLVSEKGADNIEFSVSPAEETSFKNSSFDCITAAQCFWYFDREKIIKEIKRLLKPNGIFVKIYMSYSLDDEIAKKSHELVKKINTSWTPAASGSKDMYNHPFENGHLDVFECKLPFTRESWHGRMLACRGTKASMDKETLAKWEKAHITLLSQYPEEFEINHKIYIATYKI